MICDRKRGSMALKVEVFEAVQRERRYQDRKHGTLNVHGHSVAEWLFLVEDRLAKAKKAWVMNGDTKALEEMLTIVATGVACLEQHGIVERN